MKQLCFTFCALLCAMTLSAQSESNYTVELRTGIQKVDERSLFEEDQLNRFSSTYVGLVAQRRIFGTASRLKGWAGLSIGQEQQNFNREINSDFCRFCVFCNCISAKIPTPIESYKQYLAGLPVTLQYKVSDRWKLQLEYRPDFVFHKRVLGNEGAKWDGFEFLDHNLRPSISYQLGRCQIGIAANFRSGRDLDPFYYEEFLKSGLTESTVEYFDFGAYRPLRFDVSVGYSW